MRLTRSFDQRSHTYQGYVLRLRERVGTEDREFAVALGEKSHIKFQFRIGDVVRGEGEQVADARLEIADLYKISKVAFEKRGELDGGTPPPWHGIPPALTVYRERGHRRLEARTYDAKCSSCVWGCRMAVEMIIDQWNPGRVQYRQETFCYGPLSCSIYKPGPTRKVPGRKGMSWEEEGWVDEDAVRHSAPDE
ncbi:MAG: hypothetical protein NT062_24980 [Proteobacteria bacterium]|nr:hypothetical protein [Pseudomonadota bacterium]